MKTLKGYKVNILSEEDNINIKEILVSNRKILQKDEEVFFSPSYKDLFDPSLLNGTGIATERILKAIENKERVVVFGDYDVDGVSSTAMLVRFFHEIGIDVSYRLPHRVTDGYGLKKYFIDDLSKNNVKLIVTVDCGTRDIEVVNYSNSLGIDVIITDHHSVPDIIPENVIALINPKKLDSTYPNKDLSGSGVAFKLLHAISLKIHTLKETEIFLKNYIDFAMLGTVADCMPLIGENRVIAYLGLKQLKNSKSHGLKRLIEGSDPDNLDGDVVGFKIGPKLNAAGRMDTPYKALKVLLAGENNLDEALEEIENLNAKRKISTEKFALEAYKNIDNSKNVLFFESDNIEHGIIGLIAGRLCEAFNKIAIVFKNDGEKLVGSARGPNHTSIVEIFEQMPELFEVFGGHKQAAGFTITKNNLDKLKEKLENTVTEIVKDIDIQRIINIESEIELNNVSFDTIKLIESFRPFGFGNNKPLFIIKDIIFDRIEYLGKDKKHLKFFINGKNIEFKAFGLGEHYELLNKKDSIGIIFEIEKNVWNSRETLSLNIKDFLA
ncbi:MAG: single-stranded-DNA-specific exonuclease RecJ [Candidatus Gracilibacteria bacterium]|nr:single-stranded-DNA-specific exonuclease RecJ [Candidatus Gracilibacteria bacterium]MDD2908671.1 single-stranded-DNA-specific exonuclease RecJ [Candidatus Gracilibacteria bacterium]